MRAMYTVLIADDEAIVRMMLSSMIDWDEMELKLAACVSNGREALAYLEQHPVDILITDIQMPVIDGLELICRVKEFHTQPEILVLSAYNDFPYVRQAFKLGIYDYCLKREIHEEMLKRHLTNMKQLLSQKGRTQTSVAEQVKDSCWPSCCAGSLNRRQQGFLSVIIWFIFQSRGIRKSGKTSETILTKTSMSPCSTWPDRFHRLQPTGLSCRTM